MFLISVLAPPPPAVAEKTRAPRATRRTAGLLLLVLAVCAVWLVPRAAMWASADLVEDNDSVGYVRAAHAFRSLDPAVIAQRSADSVPLYPMLTALLSVAGTEMIPAARAVSLLAGAVVLLASAGIAWRLGGASAALLCALLISVHPLLARLSVSVLAESTYMAAVYAGLWCFWWHRANPRVTTGAATGMLFGLAFITRLEGLLFLAAVPLWQAMHFAGAVSRSYDARRLGAWVAAFGAGFALFAVPQIADVSQRMGGLSLNGRQAWSLLLVVDGEVSTEAALYGLDYDPGVINVAKVQQEPELRGRLAAGASAVAYGKMVLRNSERVQFEYAGKIAGGLLLMAFGVGLFALVQRGRPFDALLAGSFLVVAITAPLLQSNLLNRHLAVLVPMLCIIGAMGLIAAGRVLAPTLGGRARPVTLALCAALLVAGSWVVPLRDLTVHPFHNYTYDPVAIRQVAGVIDSAAAEAGGGVPRVSARRGTLMFFTPADVVPLPYTDLEGLTRYLRLNRVEYLLLEHDLLGERPFAESFLGADPPPGFVLLHRQPDAHDQIISVYRLSPDSAGAVPTSPLLSAGGLR